MSNVTEDQTKVPAQSLQVNIADVLAPQRGNKLFKSRGLKSFNMFTPAGKPIIFVNGLYQTDDPDIVAYLEGEIKNRHSEIFVDPNETHFDPERYDPKAAIRREIMLELAQKGMLRAAGDPTRDMGTSVQSPLKATSSSDIAPVAAGGGPTIVVGSKK